MLFILTVFFSVLQILLKIIDFEKTKSVQFAMKSEVFIGFSNFTGSLIKYSQWLNSFGYEEITSPSFYVQFDIFALKFAF